MKLNGHMRGTGPLEEMDSSRKILGLILGTKSPIRNTPGSVAELWNPRRLALDYLRSSTVSLAAFLGGCCCFPRFRRAVIVVLFLLFFGLPCTVSAGYYGEMAGDKRIAYEYLDRVADEVGAGEFDRIGGPEALALALTLGEIDKDYLTAQDFVRHVGQVVAVKGRFYKERGLSGEEIAAYLLPLRIRGEATSKPGWFATLAERFGQVTAAASTADAAAGAVFVWTVANVKPLDSRSTYPLPLRGDLDPQTVLRGGYGTEVDRAIFVVGALRACGVAARFVWTPALRGEPGGKAWLEYLGESGKWIPWVPSFGAAGDHLAKLRRELGPKIVFVMARPEAPVEITAAYVETAGLEIQTTRQDVTVTLLVLGRDELLAARGLYETVDERSIHIGAGRVIVAAVFSNLTFALLPVDVRPGPERTLVIANAGGLSVGKNAEATETEH